MNNEQRIKLAEFVGHGCSCSSDLDISCKVHDLGDILGCPDPFTDANDCEALIRALNGNEYMVVVQHGNPADFALDIVVMADEVWQGDDYKQGVCELALRVLNGD